MESNRW